MLSSWKADLIFLPAKLWYEAREQLLQKSAPFPYFFQKNASPLHARVQESTRRSLIYCVAGLGGVLVTTSVRRKGK
jgi:hypothetical protein